MANPNGLNLPHHLMQLFFDSESESSDSESGFTGSAGPRINPMASCFFDLDSEDSSGVRGEDSIKAVEWRNRLFPSFTSEQFRCEFRVTRATFDFILSRIRSDLEKKAHEDKRGKPRTPAQFQLGMLLYYVATGQPLRTVGQLFAYGETTAGDSVRRCTQAVIDVLQTVIHLPRNDNEWKTVASKFSALAGIPNVGLAMDGSYILCRAPSERLTVPGGPYVTKDFWCHKGFYAILLLAACDADYMFRFVDVGWPGGTSDSAAYERSELGRNIDTLLPEHVFILGDKIFPNSDRLITPFKTTTRLQDHRFKRYNKYHCQTRVPIENAFGRLKMRFGIMRVGVNIQTCVIPDIILVCCILHNICQSRNDPMDEEALAAFIIRERETDQENHEAYLMTLAEDNEHDEDLILQLNPIFDLDVTQLCAEYSQQSGRNIPPNQRLREAVAEYLIQK